MSKHFLFRFVFRVFLDHIHVYKHKFVDIMPLFFLRAKNPFDYTQRREHIIGWREYICVVCVVILLRLTVLTEVVHICSHSNVKSMFVMGNNGVKLPQEVYRYECTQIGQNLIRWKALPTNTTSVNTNTSIILLRFHSIITITVLAIYL